MSSSRLPAKVLLPIAGIPLAVLCAQRIARTGMDVVLATSDEKSDDVLVDESIKYKIRVCRGSLSNVLDRFAKAVKDLNDDDVVVRVTADNPVIDADFVHSLVKVFSQSDIDCLGTSSPLDGLPYGLSAEVMTVGALRLAHKKAGTSYEREHVTPWIHGHLRTQIVDGYVLTEQKDLSFLRCTVDTFDDYIRVNEVFSAPHIDAVRASWEDLINELEMLPSTPEFHVPYRTRRGSVESVISLGTVQLGLQYGIANQSGMPDALNATEIVRQAIEHGVSWIDTARGYGISEKRVGKALSSGWSSRTRLVTKLDPLAGIDEMYSTPCVKNAVKLSIFTSLNSLGISGLDVLLLHRWEHRTSNHGQIWETLLELKEQGLINELGASIYNPEEAMDALLDDNITHLQLPFNLLDQRWLKEDFQNALAKRKDVRIHVRSIFLQGLLVNDAKIWPDWDDEAHLRVAAIKALRRQFSRKNRADLCMAYVLAQDWIDSIVIGVETLQQLDQNLRMSCENPLSDIECQVMVDQLSDTSERLLNPSQW